jgi:hypothetical protein
MMGVRMPVTCWAVHKRQVINLRYCCIWLGDSVESMTIHGLANPKSLYTFRTVFPSIIRSSRPYTQHQVYVIQVSWLLASGHEMEWSSISCSSGVQDCTHSTRYMSHRLVDCLLVDTKWNEGASRGEREWKTV